MKLIIDIPDEMYRKIKNDEYTDVERYCGMLSIQNGTPLDDVMLKIEQDMCFDMFNDYGNETAIHRELWEIFDNIGKAESEEV